MKRLLVIGIILLFLFCNISFTTLSDENNGNFNGKTLYVGGSGPGNYTKIQDAIDNASDGDTVFVYSGTYYENIQIYTSINLVGENKDTTIIDGGGIGNVVFVSDDWVNIFGFTIQNSGGSQDFGIKTNSDFNCFSNNNIFNNLFGIYVISSSSNNMIIGNNVSNNKKGIFLSQLCDDNMINGNIALNNIVVGIYLEYSCDSNMIIGNNVSNNYCGIVLDWVENNILYDNSLFDSSSSYNAWDNRLTNIWYNSTFQYGNYYDDYTGVDEDGDGIGDIPYDIPVVGNVDRYPLMVTRGENHVPNTPTIDGAVEGNAGETYDYSFISIDQDGNNILYLIEWGDGEVITVGPYASGEEAEVSHTWQDQDTYTIRAKAIDMFGAESDWSTLQVKMPKNRLFNPLLQLLERLIECFPNLQHLFRIWEELV